MPSLIFLIKPDIITLAIEVTGDDPNIAEALLENYDTPDSVLDLMRGGDIRGFGYRDVSDGVTVQNSNLPVPYGESTPALGVTIRHDNIQIDRRFVMSLLPHDRFIGINECFIYTANTTKWQVVNLNTAVVRDLLTT